MLLKSLLKISEVTNGFLSYVVIDSNKVTMWTMNLASWIMFATDNGQVDETLSTEQTSDEVNWTLWMSRPPRSINIPHYYDILCICIK